MVAREWCVLQCKYEISSVSPSFMLTCLNFWLHAPGSTWKDRCTQGLKQQKLISEKIKLPSTKKSLVNFCKPDTFSFQLQYGTYCFATLETTTSPEVLMLHSAPVSDPCNGKQPSNFWRYQPLEAENHPFKPKENHLNQTLHFFLCSKS